MDDSFGYGRQNVKQIWGIGSKVNKSGKRLKSTRKFYTLPIGNKSKSLKHVSTLTLAFRACFQTLFPQLRKQKKEKKESTRVFSIGFSPNSKARFEGFLWPGGNPIHMSVESHATETLRQLNRSAINQQTQEVQAFAQSATLALCRHQEDLHHYAAQHVPKEGQMADLRRFENALLGSVDELRSGERLDALETYLSQKKELSQQLVEAALVSGSMDLARQAKEQKEEIDELRGMLNALRATIAADETRRRKRRDHLISKLDRMTTVYRDLWSELYAPCDRYPSLLPTYAEQGGDPVDSSSSHFNSTAALRPPGNNPILQQSLDLRDTLTRARQENAQVRDAFEKVKGIQTCVSESQLAISALQGAVESTEQQLIEPPSVAKLEAVRERLLQKKEQVENEVVFVDPAVAFTNQNISTSLFVAPNRSAAVSTPPAADEFLPAFCFELHQERIQKAKTAGIRLVTPSATTSLRVEANSSKGGPSAIPRQELKPTSQRSSEYPERPNRSASGEGNGGLRATSSTSPGSGTAPLEGPKDDVTSELMQDYGWRPYSIPRERTNEGKNGQHQQTANPNSLSGYGLPGEDKPYPGLPTLSQLLARKPEITKLLRGVTFTDEGSTVNESTSKEVVKPRQTHNPSGHSSARKEGQPSPSPLSPLQERTRREIGQARLTVAEGISEMKALRTKFLDV